MVVLGGGRFLTSDAPLYDGPISGRAATRPPLVAIFLLAKRLYPFFWPNDFFSCQTKTGIIFLPDEYMNHLLCQTNTRRREGGWTDG